MKVVCIDNKGYHPELDNHFCLTIGKEYDAYIGIYECDFYYEVMNDIGTKCPYSMKYFINQEEMRDKKLEELGI